MHEKVVVMKRNGCRGQKERGSKAGADANHVGRSARLPAARINHSPSAGSHLSSSVGTAPYLSAVRAAEHNEQIFHRTS